MADPKESGHHRIANTFNYRVVLRRSAGVIGDAPDLLGDGGFQECSGLEIEMDAQELNEGGLNDGVIRLVGRGKYSTIVLKRGMFYAEKGKVNTESWSWLQSVISGTRPVTRYDGMIEVLDNAGGRALATWSFLRGLPVRMKGPDLNAKTGDLAIEELHIAHEGLRLELTP